MVVMENTGQQKLQNMVAYCQNVDRYCFWCLEIQKNCYHFFGFYIMFYLGSGELYNCKSLLSI